MVRQNLSTEESSKMFYNINLNKFHKCFMSYAHHSKKITITFTVNSQESSSNNNWSNSQDVFMPPPQISVPDALCFRVVPPSVRQYARVSECSARYLTKPIGQNFIKIWLVVYSRQQTNRSGFEGCEVMAKYSSESLTVGGGTHINA